MSRTPSIAIVGGGIGGATAALLLGQIGCACTVYEQAADVTRVGAGINFAPNGTRAFRMLGLEEKLFAAGLQHREKLNRDWNTGKLTYRVNTEGLAELYGAPFLTIHRGDLAGILTGALPPGTLKLGKRLAGLDDDGRSVRLKFADGTTVTADMVIGADGVNSVVRDLLLGPERPSYSGDVAYRSIYPRERLKGVDLPDCTKWWTDDGRYILIYFISWRRDQVYIVGGGPDGEWGADDYAPQDVPLLRLRGYFRDFHPEVQAVLAAATSATRWAILERKPFPLWSRGRVVLLGDACHPMTPYMGQGACMAVEDAMMIVRCLRETGFDADAAFRLYAANRIDRTAAIQAESKKKEWMRYTMDHEWVFGYDPFKVPLVPA